MSPHTCGAVLPADVTAVVEHLAYCPETRSEIAAWCRQIVREVAQSVPTETVERSRKTFVRSCERCGNTFETTNVRKRFCSTPCRSGGYRERSGGAA